MDVTNRTLFLLLRESGLNLDNHKKLMEVLVFRNIGNIAKLNDESKKDVALRLQKYCGHLRDRWRRCGGKVDRFLKTYDKWLNLEYSLSTS